MTATFEATLALIPEGWRVHSLGHLRSGWSACLHRDFGSDRADEEVWRKGRHWPKEHSANGRGETPTEALANAIDAIPSVCGCARKGLGGDCDGSCQEYAIGTEQESHESGHQNDGEKDG